MAGLNPADAGEQLPPEAWARVAEAAVGLEHSIGDAGHGRLVGRRRADCEQGKAKQKADEGRRDCENADPHPPLGRRSGR
jgi:hypothetical protein